MSKSLIKIGTLKYYQNKQLDFDNIILPLNLSFDNLSHKDKFNIFDENINIKKIDFIEEKSEDNNEIQSILNILNNKSEINIREKQKEDNNYNECQEIINILKKPLSEKNVRFYSSPFKPLLKPRKISMEGKVLYNSPKYEMNINNVNSLDTQNSSNCGNIIGNKIC